MGFFLEVLIGGLLAGMLYALVALGFVLIFKRPACSISPRGRCTCERSFWARVPCRALA